MTVNSEFGGQKFIPSQLDKIRQLRAMTGGRPIKLSVDGGIVPETARACIDAGADVLIAGSSVFRNGGNAYAGNIQALRC